MKNIFSNFYTTMCIFSLLNISELDCFASPDIGYRLAGDERKFEARHVFWHVNDQDRIYNDLENFPSIEDRIFLRSGTIVGAREFEDFTTLTFELATGSRFGHVAIAISAADYIETYLRLLERGCLSKSYNQVKDKKIGIFNIVELEDFEKAMQPYIKLGDQLGWSNEQDPNPNEHISFHPINDEGDESFCMEHHKIFRLLNQGHEGRNFTYENLLEIRENIKNGRGRFYETNVANVLSNPVYIHFSPNEVKVEARWSDEALGDAIYSGNTSIIEPTRDLTIEEVEKIIFYAMYLSNARAKYNYSQTKAGLYKQNCSEFVCHAFENLGYQVGFEQTMDSLNINTIGGGLRNAKRLLGKYSPKNIVITPKSVMQTAVPYEDLPEAQEDAPSLPMRVVPEFDRLKVAETVSDYDLWHEWEDQGRLHWTYRVAKNVFGNTLGSLSKKPFEKHSADGLKKSNKANWSRAQLGLLGLTAIGLGYKYFQVNSLNGYFEDK